MCFHCARRDVYGKHRSRLFVIVLFRGREKFKELAYQFGLCFNCYYSETGHSDGHGGAYDGEGGPRPPDAIHL